MAQTLVSTDYNFPGQEAVYHGKVRDVYTLDGDRLVMIATDRISAFDVILPKGIPYKGQVLNSIAAKFLDATADAVPNWKRAVPDPMVTAGVRCEGFRVEMIIRGYLTGTPGASMRRVSGRSAECVFPRVCARTSVSPSLSSLLRPRPRPAMTRISRERRS